MSDSNVMVEVVQGDVLDFHADVLALKYAQHYYGSDAAVSQRLMKKAKAAEEELQPAPGKWVWIEPGKALPSKRVLFVGVPPLIKFGYTEIADWTRQSLALCGRDYPEAKHIALTLHGPGFGLDEIEALNAELRGVSEAVKGGEAPPALQRVSVVERKAARVERLQEALAKVIAEGESGRAEPTGGPVPSPAADTTDDLDVALQAPITVHRPLKLKLRRPAEGARERRDTEAAEATGLQSAAQVENKPRVFVAMPFSDEMEDVFYYGIQNPVRQLGYICERVDQEAFTGDILQQVKMRIEKAEIVIADLTGSNANVYLEVGYAWGKGRPTVLVANKKDDLKFDVRGQRCLKYQSIKDLEKLLTAELKSLGSNRFSKQ
jgi:hypothetical protein